MSGHSKWANIKRRKGAVDAQKGRVFTRLIKEIIMAARLGGGDINGNARLRSAVAAAKTENMPKDNISRAIKKGTGEIAGEVYEEILYEGYGPGGVAVLVQCTTDNRNRTVADVRHFFAKNNGNLGESGCVAWMFEQKGQIQLEKKGIGEEALMELALEAGADDVVEEDDGFQVFSAPDACESVRESLEKAGLTILAASVAMIPKNTVEVTEESVARSLMKLMDSLEDHDDVQNVYANFDIDDALVERIS
jgi:YebC/PmpR family DNA-binding regulatory protein